MGQVATASGWPDVKDWPEFDDGFEVHAPADAHRPNGFGLYGVHGNVWEWCIDGFDSAYYQRSPALDPVCPPGSSATRVNRGGCFANAAALARSANRGSDAPTVADRYLGLRPARALDPQPVAPQQGSDPRRLLALDCRRVACATARLSPQRMRISFGGPSWVLPGGGVYGIGRTPYCRAAPMSTIT